MLNDNSCDMLCVRTPSIPCNAVRKRECLTEILQFPVFGHRRKGLFLGVFVGVGLVRENMVPRSSHSSVLVGLHYGM